MLIDRDIINEMILNDTFEEKIDDYILSSVKKSIERGYFEFSNGIKIDCSLSKASVLSTYLELETYKMFPIQPYGTYYDERETEDLNENKRNRLLSSIEKAFTF